MKFNLINLFISISIGILLFFIIKFPNNTLMDNEIQNTGHSLLFGLLAILSLKGYRLLFTKATQLHTYIVVFIFLAFIGISIELLQIPLQRDADIIDFLRDLVGVITVLGLDYFLLIKKTNGIYRLKTKDYVILIFCLMIFIAGIFPITSLSLAYNNRNNDFPTIINFKSIYSRYFFRTYNASIENVQINDFSLITLKQSKRAGFVIIEPIPNWHDYHEVCFKIYSTNSKVFEIGFRIHDEKHNFRHTDRFNTHIKVTPQPHKYCYKLSDIEGAPINRNMNLNQIEKIHFYKSNNSSELQFYLSKIWLE